jgi:hypothetical protein
VSEPIAALDRHLGGPPERFDVTVLGFGHAQTLSGGTRSVVPVTPDYCIRAGDTLLPVGEQQASSRLASD